VLRSVLVPLDGSSSSERAADLSFELALRYGAHVCGLTVGGAPMTGLQERGGTVAGQFLSRASARGISSIDAREVGAGLVEVVVREAAAFDMIALGRESLADVGGELCDLPLGVEDIIRAQPRPVLLVPQKMSSTADEALTGPVLVAFDGSAAASRTAHLFGLLGLARDRRVHVVTLDEASETDAGETAGTACRLLSRHGALEVHPIGLGDSQAGTPSETILGLAKSLDATMVVMGAFGHRGMRELFGSCTAKVLRECSKPLFLYH
jgi:nucleotide-binding universal stress UspA family protein